MTRFEDLEETHAEVKLKQTLWESQREWEHDYETWTTVRITCTCTCIAEVQLENFQGSGNGLVSSTVDISGAKSIFREGEFPFPLPLKIEA